MIYFEVINYQANFYIKYFLCIQGDLNDQDDTGKRIYLWDYGSESPLHTDDLPGVRFGGNQIVVSNRYLPECRSMF